MTNHVRAFVMGLLSAIEEAARHELTTLPDDLKSVIDVLNQVRAVVGAIKGK